MNALNTSSFFLLLLGFLVSVNLKRDTQKVRFRRQGSASSARARAVAVAARGRAATCACCWPTAPSSARCRPGRPRSAPSSSRATSGPWSPSPTPVGWSASAPPYTRTPGPICGGRTLAFLFHRLRSTVRIRHRSVTRSLERSLKYRMKSIRSPYRTVSGEIHLNVYTVRR